jgi:hypothetical protein
VKKKVSATYHRKERFRRNELGAAMDDRGKGRRIFWMVALEADRLTLNEADHARAGDLADHAGAPLVARFDLASDAE